MTDIKIHQKTGSQAGGFQPQTKRAGTRPVLKLSLAAAILMSGIPVSPAAVVSLKSSDLSGNSSFAAVGNWNNSLAPAAGNTYYTTNFTLRTPFDATSRIFAGDSLSADAGGGVLGKTSGTTQVLTVTNFILNGGTFQEANSSLDNNILTWAGNISVNAATVMGAVGGPTNGSPNFETLNITAVISGSAALQVSGSINAGGDTGIVKLDAANPYSGTITVTNGYTGSVGAIASTANRILQLNNVNALSNATLNIVATVTNPVSFTSASNTAPFNIGALAGKSSEALVDTAGNPITLSVGGNNTGSTFSGDLTAAGALVVTGTGTFALSSANTFTGNTTVSSGTLALTGSGSMANTANIMVSNGAIFDVSAVSFTLGGSQSLLGSGTINGSVNTAAGTRIYGGGASGYATNTFNNNLTFATGAFSYLNVGTVYNETNDLIVVGGTLTLNSNTVHLKAPSTLVNLDTTADYVLFTAAGGISGSFAGAVSWDVQPLNFGNFVVVTDLVNNQVRLHYSPATPPTGSGTATPANVARNQNTLISVTVTNSSNPISTVTLNASPVGGSASLSMILVGTTTNVYTNTITVSAGTSLGTVILTNTLVDTASLSGSAFVSLNVVANQEVWNGGGSDNNWSTNPNWAGGLAPGLVGDGVTFAGTTRLTPSMNGSYSLSTLTFGATAGSFVVAATGNNILTMANGLTNNSTSVQTLNVPVTLNGVQTFNAAAGGLTLQQAITNGGSTLTLAGAFHSSIDGGIAGSGGLTETGGGTVVLSGTNTYSGATTLNSGILQITGSGSLGGGSYAAKITNNGILQYSSAAGQTLSGVISGSGGVTKDGTGALTLSGTNTYSGATVVTAGSLVYNYAFPAGGSTNGALLVSNATVAFNASAAISSLPVGNLTLNQNATLNFNFNFSGGNPAVATVSAVTNLTVSGAPITINISGYGAAVGQFPLIAYASAPLASITNFVLGSLPPGITASLVNNTANKSIDLNVATEVATTWVSLTTSDAGGSSSFNAAGNWSNLAAPSGANGYFDKSYALRTPANATDYAFGGAALSIEAGATLLGKTTGTTQVLTVNDFILNGGNFEQANTSGDNAILTWAGNITVNAPSFFGAVGAAANNNTDFETLNITATISGSAALQLSGSAINSGADTGVVVLDAANPYSGTLTVTNGYSGSTAVIASAVNRLLQLNNVNALRYATLNLISTVANPVSFTAASNTAPFNLGALAGASSQALTDTAGNAITLSVGGNNASSSYTGALTDGGAGAALVKTGAGTLTLAGTNTYTGDTTVSGGTLALRGSGSLNGSANLIIGGGASLDVSGETAAFTLGASQVLVGSSATGNLIGNVNLGDGSLVLDYAGGTPVLSETGGALNFSGNAVTVTVSGTPLGAGNYLLISTNTGGSVAGTLPSTVTINGIGTAGITTNYLANVGGQLYLVVQSVGNNNVGGQVDSLNFAGSSPSLTFTGIPGYKYNVQVSTNLSDWTTLYTTNAPASGEFLFQDNNPLSVEAFYRLMWNGN